MKHSNVQHAALDVVRRGDALYLTVKDGGIGFDLNAVAQGLGLASMKERLRMVNGNLTVRSGPGNGTELMAEVPLKAWIPQARAG
jgi:two-component system sensor kinase